MKNKEVRAQEPKILWNHFADINAIPRASKKEAQIIQFMLDFGNNLGLETQVDPVGNVIIRKAATKGMEDRKTVVLQSHLDMVHQKNADTIFDFETEGIDMYVDGDWIKAKGTTLGADNGVGVAAIMSVLSSDDLEHPALEALFTIDEETGMTGAQGLEANLLSGEILLNLDTEEEDEIDIGCAGGIDVTAQRNYKEQKTHANDLAFQLKVKGLQGGHSGMDIHKGFGNANKLMNSFLKTVSSFIRLNSIEGGGLRNAIPRESAAIFVCSPEHKNSLQDALNAYAAKTKQQFKEIEPHLEFDLSATDTVNNCMEQAAQDQLFSSIDKAINGVYKMSEEIPDLVEASNNIARVTVKDGHIKISCLTRSSVEASKEEVAQSLRKTFEENGFSVEFSGDYPGWSPNRDSAILKVLTEIYENIFHSKPGVVACHAGLECGILGRNYPDMDMISFGPTIKGAHSPDERASIASSQRFWKFLQEILKHIPVKE